MPPDRRDQGGVAPSPLDRSRIARTVALIPAGRWMSYGDIARACGGTDRHARTLNQHFIRRRVVGAHRVLLADGAVSPTALGDPVGVRTRLEDEGVRFVGGRASQAHRLRARDLAGIICAEADSA
jgi:alkylated DNA nucleotide flippase Atl1